MPAITLPTIRASIVGDAPHIADPASKRTTLPMNSFFISNREYSKALCSSVRIIFIGVDAI